MTWLFHQYRAIYDLCGTPFSEFTDTEADVRLRDRLIGLDTEVLAESKRLFSNARNTAARLAKYNGLAAEPLYHPPPLAGALTAGPFGDYVLSVGRLERNKRVDLIVRALAADRPLRPAGHRRRRVAAAGARDDWRRQLGVADRVTFTGDHRRSAAGRAVRGRPRGGLSAARRGLRLRDARSVSRAQAGGDDDRCRRAARIRRRRRQRPVAEPDAEAIAAAIARLAADRALARRLGEAGFERARTITWDGVVERLVG